MTDRPAEFRDAYSPRLRTALVLTGTGTAGAYHAGVLRAFHEAGVKIDLVAGRGVGVVGAMFSAVDGASHLWDPNGLWRARGLSRLYPWHWRLRVAAAIAAASIVLTLLPITLYAITLFGYALLTAMGALSEGAGALQGLAAWIDAHPVRWAIGPSLGTNLAIVLLGLLIIILAVGVRRSPRRRIRERSPVWWRAVGAPLNAAGAISRFLEGLWHLMHGATPVRQPTPLELSRRYTELLVENLGQPGFRELIVLAHDLDARRDLVFAALAEPYRREFFLSRRTAGRGAETIDLAGVGRDHAADALAGALSLPIATEPHLMPFAAESSWRGETHRLCDRPAAVVRLLEEAAAAGAEQVIAVSAAAELPGPHALGARRADGRGRVGEYFAATDAASLRDAVTAHAALFSNIFLIRPEHNPLGPFDFGGCYDQRSDRIQSVDELIARGYDDAYRQFIEPIVGASGERLERIAASGPERR